MKGIIFSVLSKFIEEKKGLEVLDEVLEKTNLESGGVYTSLKTYPDAEFITILKTFSEISNLKHDEILFELGKYMLIEMSKTYPTFFEVKSLKEFLLSIHDVIHVEVRKLFPDALTPQFSFENNNSNELTMIYKSTRQLCRLAEGLIHGASEYYKTPIEVSQSQCYLRGDPNCRIEIKFLS